MNRDLSMRRFVVVGAGGHARETAWLISVLGASVRGFIVSDLTKVGPRDCVERLLGDYEWLAAHRSEFDAITIGVGLPASRLKIAAELEPLFDEDWWPPLVHPSNPLDRASCKLAPGAALAAGSIATVGVRFEAHAFANFGCSIGHESVIGRGSVVNPGASISGGVTIGAGVLVGSGSTILQYRSVGDGATIGAGAVVTRDVAPGQVVVGVPARPLPR